MDLCEKLIHDDELIFKIQVFQDIQRTHARRSANTYQIGCKLIDAHVFCALQKHLLPEDNEPF